MRVDVAASIPFALSARVGQRVRRDEQGGSGHATTSDKHSRHCRRRSSATQDRFHAACKGSVAPRRHRTPGWPELPRLVAAIGHVISCAANCSVSPLAFTAECWNGRSWPMTASRSGWDVSRRRARGRDCSPGTRRWHKRWAVAKYSAHNAATKYSPLDQINRANVGKLKVAWRRSHTPADIPLSPALRPNNNFRSTPIMVDGVLYASNGLGLAEAFDPVQARRFRLRSPRLFQPRRQPTRCIHFVSRPISVSTDLGYRKRRAPRRHPEARSPARRRLRRGPGAASIRFDTVAGATPACCITLRPPHARRTRRTAQSMM